MHPPTVPMPTVSAPPTNQPPPVPPVPPVPATSATRLTIPPAIQPPSQPTTYSPVVKPTTSTEPMASTECLPQATASLLLPARAKIPKTISYQNQYMLLPICRQKELIALRLQQPTADLASNYD
jgi:hypothetical protein